MRRSRFASAIETVEPADERASINEAFWVDLHTPETSDESSLADWRVAGLDQIALLLGFTHLLVIAGYVVLSTKIPLCACSDNPLIPSLIALGLDAVAAVALLKRHKYKFSAHTIVRGLCCYLGLSGLLWM